MTPVARKLRRNSTDAEQRLWHHLRGRRLEGVKFVRQLPIGAYIADFAAREAHLIIELDGGQHDLVTDAARTQALENFGYRVIRFWNHDVLQNTYGVLEAIRNELLLGFNRSE
nr:DUF559 domain-containing protein [Sphingomonas arenae]